MTTLEFTDREWTFAYRVAMRVLRNPTHAEDAAQDAMLRAYRYRARFSGDAKPESWLFRIAHNTALSYLRKPFFRRHSNHDVFSLIDDSSHSQPTDSPLDAAVALELARELETCMRGLRHEDRLAFTERFLLGTSERELGDILGVSTNAAKQRAFRARRRLRQCMSSKGAPT